MWDGMNFFMMEWMHGCMDLGVKMAGIGWEGCGYQIRKGKGWVGLVIVL